MNYSILFLISIILLIVFIYEPKNKETYDSAAITQLIAKGPMDTYLTGNVWKYIPYNYYGWNYPWHNPTRLSYFPYYPHLYTYPSLYNQLYYYH